jgi:D-alanyl-D-alanine dipeptidase
MKIKITFLNLLLISAAWAKQEDAQKLVAVNDVNSNIKIECMYATHNNFTGQRVYPKKLYNRTYLLKHVAQQLSKVQEELEQQGLGLLIWDAFRPMQGQQALWDACPDKRFVAPPTKGGRHTRGTTVDLTIINLETNEPLDMGTGFDAFIDRSKSNFKDLTPEALKNRDLLQTVMKKHGFTTVTSEWWHFDYDNYKNHPPLDVKFDELN